MLARGILGSGRTRSVSFRSFPNSSGWWWLISSIFLIRISCHKTTHANGYYGAWPGWAVSISVLPLTQRQEISLTFISRYQKKSAFVREGNGVIRVVAGGLWPITLIQSLSWWCTHRSATMDASERDFGKWTDTWCLLLTFPKLFRLVVAY